MNVAFLCLGGNMGDRLANLSRAKVLIIDKGINIMIQSSIYETKAWGVSNSPDYYNQCLKITTGLTAPVLMEVFLDVEKELGRVRTENKNQSRTIDIDVLLFNNEIIKTELIEIPHPRIHLRQFVLKPLNEIASDIMHPVFKKTINQLLQICTDTLSAKKIEQDVHLH
ncbi:MAG TPA: 2-amino-4-hydroxy-6-hydroxymethyldihydropteridine diphosphokinase [Bacteroidia bacterium]|jgi:2-amino-4-hydroxy-6-hydroxymethyldihydropteridine diphosphokinase|nr:2-amino-4-hydroxy-6-hydroxymethyldihydropteridine diphosphokinase [Bacteroidia bacterium]